MYYIPDYIEALLHSVEMLIAPLIKTKLKHGDDSTTCFFAPVQSKDATLNSKMLGFSKWSENI